MDKMISKILGRAVKKVDIDFTLYGVEAVDTVFKNNEISIETTNEEGLFYITDPSRDYEFVAYYKEV